MVTGNEDSQGGSAYEDFVYLKGNSCDFLEHEFHDRFETGEYEALLTQVGMLSHRLESKATEKSASGYCHSLVIFVLITGRGTSQSS